MEVAEEVELAWQWHDGGVLCDVCGGTGTQHKQRPTRVNGYAHWMVVAEPCWRCRGEGVVGYRGERLVRRES